jgi:diguanylate cyclase (GGDEF)-like protein/PAS domain S-box-containing protein
MNVAREIARLGSPFRSGSLSSRLSLIGLSTAVLSVLLTAGGLITVRVMQLRSSLESEMKTVADILALNNTAPLHFGDSTAAAENLSALKADPHVIGSCLFGRSGQLFASYARSGSRNYCPVSAGSGLGLAVHLDFANYVAPILLDQESLGTISVCRDLEEARARARDSLLMLAAVLTGVLLFAIWLSSRMTRAIVRPISALVRTSRKVSDERNYSLRVTLPSGSQHGELGLLIDSFNHMLSKVEESNRELASHRERLEEEVTARTGDLVRLNRELTEELQARTTAENALRDSEERYALAMNGANDGLWDWDLKTGTIYFSSRWKAMLGLCEEEVSDQPEEWLDRAHPGDAARLRGELEAHWAGRTTEFQFEGRMRHKDGGYRWTLSRGLAIRAADGRVTRMAGSQTDITEAKVSDPLTGLANRILFTDRLTRSIEQIQREPDRLFGVLFLDLDRFKVINDSLGHLAGDELLVDIAQRLCATVRSSDLAPHLPGPCIVARLGGDEFAVLLENIETPEDARCVADRILRDLSAPFHLQGRVVFTTVSIGVALGNREYGAAEEILRDADTAMYAAKASGKARYAVFDAAMGTRAVARLEIETDLRRALAADELVLHYQPEVALRTGKIIGFEALVRWRHPKRGLVSPNEFIPIAEETGLIVPLGDWVLEQACQKMRQWQLEFPDLCDLKISVNLSGKQFASPDLVPVVEQVLRNSGLRPECLDLEITESVLMEDADAAIRTLLDLKALGVGLQIDDFGTGYSSLSYLHRLPFDTLKIDRSFVSSMGIQEDGLEIVRTIMALAQSLRMRVVAEGVENRSQLAYLRDMGCGFGQGYHFFKPLDVDTARLLLAARSSVREEVPGLVLAS